MAWGERIRPRILLNQNEKVNLDKHIIVRGLLIERSIIAGMEEAVGGTLIPDSQVTLLADLDYAAEHIRVKNNGMYTPERTLEVMGARYVHRDLIISPDVFEYQWGMKFGLGNSTIRSTKKIWFRCLMAVSINRSARTKGDILIA